MSKTKKDGDVVAAVSYYKASQAGALDEEITPHQAGVLGGAFTETTKNVEDFATGKQSAGELKENIKNVIATAVVSMAHKVVDMAGEYVKKLIPPIPVLHDLAVSAIDLGRNVIKDVVATRVGRLVGKVVEVGTKVVKEGVKWGKKIFSFLFG
ncbi:MAG: hypothetical protein ACUVQP_09660 [Bacteroidales bacterium]